MQVNLIRLGLIIVCLQISSGRVFGQDSQTNDSATPETTSEEASDSAKWDKDARPSSGASEVESPALTDAINRMKSAGKELWEFSMRFHTQTGDITRKEQAEWAKIQERYRLAMDDAYAEAARIMPDDPKQSPKLFRFLLHSTGYRFSHDWYENAYAGARRLKECGVDDPELERGFGLSALAVHDYDAAAESLRIALEADKLNEVQASLFFNIPAVRKDWEREKAMRAKDAEADNLPRVVFHTTRGEITIELFEDQAPNTVANFIALVEEGFYDNTAFHTVTPGQFVQMGCPEGDGTGDVGYSIADEFSQPDARAFFRGSLLTAKIANSRAEEDPNVPATIPNSASSQFLILLLPLRMPRMQLTSFGRVIDGMGAISTLNQANPNPKEGEPPPPLPDTILSAEVIRKRDHEYRPKVTPFQ